jgi:hypothetical protein
MRMAVVQQAQSVYAIVFIGGHFYYFSNTMS